MELRDALRDLARFVHDPGVLPDPVAARASDVLLDTLGVTLAGARTPELERLRASVGDETGPSRPLGTTRHLPVTTAAWLDGTAACCLELDEGNKRARGHPAAHVLPAVLAIAATVEVDGHGLLTAFVAGHEVATRIAEATHLHPGVHPHGNASTAGAAAATARLLGLGPDQIAGALDAATALPLATDFAAALDGSFVRNTWIGQANASGINAARLAAAGLATVDGRAAGTLGRILGHLDVERISDGLGHHFAVTDGYLKRHSSCSYTHPPADAALELLDQGVRPGAVHTIEVATHHLAAGLDRHATPTRLAAMFSIPYVVAATLVHGRFDVAASDAATREDPDVRRLVEVTTVVHDPSLDARLPAERPARVTVHLDDGTRTAVEVANPVGDVAHHPLDRADIVAKLDGLLHPGEAAHLAGLVEALPSTPRAADLLAELP